MQTPVGKYAEKLCREFRSSSTRALARKLQAEYPHHFKTSDAPRDLIRTYRGKLSKRMPKKRISEEIPAAISETKKPWCIEEIDITKALVIADVHVPFHDKKALEIAIDYGIKKGCKDIIINGDFFDHYQFSSFERDPKVRTVQDENEKGLAILEVLERNFSGKKIFKKGNHDERYELYLKRNAPELLDLDIYSFESVHGLDSWDVYGEKRPLKAGHLYLLHGHEYKGGFVSPVNPARGIFIKAYESVLSAHQHQSSQHRGTSLGGRIISTASQGCLCHLHPQYMPLNQWQHGFAIVEMEDKNFHVDNKIIINGKVY